MAKIIGAESVSIPAICIGIRLCPREICVSIMFEKVTQWLNFQGVQAQKLAEK